jgi:hypothetical protein
VRPLKRQLCDADVGHGGTVLLYRAGARHTIVTDAGEIPFHPSVRYPAIRRVRPGLVLVVGLRSDGERNAHLVTDRGELVRSFFVGDGIEDVLICGSRIVVTYGDEGVFGDFPEGREGLAVFDTRGEMLWGYHTRFGHAVNVVDCYCACTDGADRLWFSPYMEFPLVEVNLERRTQSVTELPAELHGCAALTTDGHTFHFAIPHLWRHLRRNPAAAPPDAGESQILRWDRISGVVTTAGHVAGRPRALPNGRFISVLPDEYRVFTPAAMK